MKYLLLKYIIRWTLKGEYQLMVLLSMSNGQVWDQSQEKVSIDIKLLL